MTWRWSELKVPRWSTDEHGGADSRCSNGSEAKRGLERSRPSPWRRSGSVFCRHLSRPLCEAALRGDAASRCTRAAEERCQGRPQGSMQEVLVWQLFRFSKYGGDAERWRNVGCEQPANSVCRIGTAALCGVALTLPLRCCSFSSLFDAGEESGNWPLERSKLAGSRLRISKPLEKPAEGLVNSP